MICTELAPGDLRMASEAAWPLLRVVKGDFYRVEIATRKTEEAARFGEAHAANGVWGALAWWGMTPDGSPLIVTGRDGGNLRPRRGLPVADSFRQSALGPTPQATAALHELPAISTSAAEWKLRQGLITHDQRPSADLPPLLAFVNAPLGFNGEKPSENGATQPVVVEDPTGQHKS